MKKCVFLLTGAIIYAVATHSFINPAHIAPGGAAGAAVLLNYMTGIPIGLLTILLNVPLLWLAWLYLSHRFAVLTAVTTIICSAVLDLLVTPFVPIYTGGRLLGSLYGGILLGIGMGFVFMAGTTTGGTDIVGFLLQKQKPDMSIGMALLIVDGVILIISILVFGNIESAAFGLLALYAQIKIIDGMVAGTLRSLLKSPKLPSKKFFEKY